MSRPIPGCATVPSMVGLTVAAARSAWTSNGFTGAFSPAAGSDTRIVDTQTTTPASTPGQCIEETATVTVTHVAPPSPNCPVPEFFNTRKNDAQSTWSSPQHGFTTTVVFNPNPSGNWRIGFQSLVGGSQQPCNSVITLSPVVP